MSVTALRLPAPTPANSARLKVLEAQSACAEHVEQWAEALETAARLAEEIADGGPLYPPGLPDLARREAERLSQVLLTIRAITQRTRSR